MERERYDGLVPLIRSINFPLLFLGRSLSPSMRRNGGMGEIRTRKQIVIHCHVEMQCADQFPPGVFFRSALRVFFLSSRSCLLFPQIPSPVTHSAQQGWLKHTVVALRRHTFVAFQLRRELCSRPSAFAAATCSL